MAPIFFSFLILLGEAMAAPAATTKHTIAGTEITVLPPRATAGTLQSNIELGAPGDLGPLAKKPPESKAILSRATLSFDTPCTSDVQLTGTIELNREEVDALLLPTYDGHIRRVAVDDPKALPARYVLGLGAAGANAGTELALPMIGISLKNGNTIGIAADPYCGIAFRTNLDQPKTLQIELSTTYLGSTVPIEKEQRIFAIATAADPVDAIFAAVYATIPDIKPAPAWVHGIRLLYYDYLSDAGQGWFRDIDELSKRLEKADRAQVVLALHGWYDYLGRYCYNPSTGQLDDKWVAFPATRKTPMSKDEIRRRLRYATERGFHTLLYYADGICYDDKAPGFNPRWILHDRAGRTNTNPWSGPDTLGKNLVCDPSNPEFRAWHMGYLAALVREFGQFTEGFVWDETFYISQEKLAVSAGKPTYADRAMMNLVAELTRRTQALGNGRLVFLASDCQGNMKIDGRDVPPYACVAHGTYQDSWGRPEAWPTALFANYRNALWSCIWAPVNKRDWNRINAEEWGLPQALSNGWLDDLGPAEMAQQQPALLDEVMKRFHECKTPRKRYLAR